jgi:fimbrial chaperone protein
MPRLSGYAHLRALVCGLALLSGSTASALQLAPLTLVLTDKAPTATLEITNETAATTSYDLSGLRWTQANGEDILTEEPALIVTPPIVTLKPGQSSLVRIALLTPPEKPGHEETYRLLVRDISEPGRSDAPLRFRLQFLLPVFRAAATPDHAFQGFAGRDQDGRACVLINNPGATHQKMVSVRVADDHKRELAIQRYVLARQSGATCASDLHETFGADFDTHRLEAGVVSAYDNKVTYHELQRSQTLAAVTQR